MHTPHVPIYNSINFIAPPRLVGTGISDCISYHVCEMPVISVDPTKDNYFNISVEYYGDNLTVDWQQNGESINCTERKCRVMSSGLYHNMVYSVP